MRSSVRLAIGMALAAFAGAGCATVGTFETASTLGKGQFEVGASSSVVSMDAGDDYSFPYPLLDMVGRYGVSDRVDISVGLGTAGTSVGTKVQLTSPENALAHVSVAPRLTYAPFLASVAQVDVPVLIGIPLAKHELVFAAKVHDYSVFAGDSSVSVWSAGGSAAFSFQLGKYVRVMPEYALLVPVYGSAAAFDEEASGELDSGVTLSQFTLGLNFGSGGN